MKLPHIVPIVICIFLNNTPDALARSCSARPVRADLDPKRIANGLKGSR